MSIYIQSGNINEFSKEASSLLQGKIDILSGYKDKGKEYQDEIVKIFHDSVIQVDSRCNLNDEKKISVITSILESSYIVDDELYRFAMERKREYKDLWDGDYGKRTNQVKEKLPEDFTIQSFVKERTKKSLTDEIGEYKKITQQFKKELDSMRFILEQVHHKNKHKQDLQQLYDKYEKNMTDEMTYYDQYPEIINSAQKSDKFRDKIIIMLQAYILSHQNADKNLKREYIKIFLWDKLKDTIQFTTGDGYMIKLGEATTSYTDISSENIYDTFMKTYEENIVKPKVIAKEGLEKKERLMMLSPQFNFSYH